MKLQEDSGATVMNTADSQNSLAQDSAGDNLPGADRSIGHDHKNKTSSSSFDKKKKDKTGKKKRKPLKFSQHRALARAKMAAANGTNNNVQEEKGE